jgi:hypothetical protein
MAWTTTYEVTFNTDDDAFEDHTLRNTLTPALVESDGTIPVGATHIRLTFESSSAEALEITDAFVGHVAASGDGWDADDLTRITFNGGSNGVVIPLGRNRASSDPIPFTYDQVRNLIVTLHAANNVAASGVGRVVSVTGFQLYYKAAANEASVLDASGYTTATSGRAFALMRVEFTTPTITRFALTIPSGKVASDQTNFVTLVDLADMPAEFWSAVDATGGYIRVEQGGNVIPFDLVSIDTGTDTGRLFFKADLATLTDNEFEIVVDDSQTLLSATATNGRNAVWSDYEAVYVFDTADDRTGNGHSITLVGTTSISGGVLNLPSGSSDYAYANTLPKFTDWTMGVSCTPSTVTGIDTVLAYTDGSDADARGSLVRNSSSNWEIWNSTDNDDNLPGGAPTNGVRVRLHGKWENTANRTGYLNGSAITNVGVQQRPGGTAPIDFVFGAATPSGTEVFRGTMDLVYLRDGLLSSNWISAEVVSWETPSTFYDAITLIANDAAEVYKTTAYSVLDRMDVAEVYKANAYSVLAAPPPTEEVRAFKTTAYSVLEPPPPLTDAARAYKAAAYSILAPGGDDPAAAFKYSYMPVVN